MFTYTCYPSLTTTVLAFGEWLKPTLLTTPNGAAFKWVGSGSKPNMAVSDPAMCERLCICAHVWIREADSRHMQLPPWAECSYAGASVSSWGMQNTVRGWPTLATIHSCSWNYAAPEIHTAGKDEHSSHCTTTDLITWLVILICIFIPLWNGVLTIWVVNDV